MTTPGSRPTRDAVIPEVRFRVRKGWWPVDQTFHKCRFGIQFNWSGKEGKWRIIDLSTGKIVKARKGYRRHASMVLCGRKALWDYAFGQKR